MPYIASNRDVREQEGFKTALMGSALAVGAIAMGGNALKKRGMGGYNGNKVAKDLYGKYGKELGSDVVDNIRVRNANDIADSGMASFGVVNGKKGPRVKATGGNPIQNFKNNHMNPEVKSFNKKIKDYSNGSDSVYSTSKLSLYDSLFDDSEKAGVGLTSKQMTGLTNDIYESAANKNIRGDNYTLKDDAQISNSIWGKGPTAREVRDNFKGMHPNGKTTDAKYKDIFKEGYNSTHGADFDEDMKVQRGKSHMWKEDIKAQMRKDGVDERANNARTRFRTERSTPDPVNRANGIFREDFDRSNLVNNITFNPNDMASKLNKVDYTPKVKSARRSGSTNTVERT